ncbi:MAG TPA: hypothetical protein VIT41_03045 [Microlunatus sp.]
MGSKARKQLKCIADAGDGSYYDADQADDLSEALRKITQRALRPYAITGIPVKGSDDPDAAPEIPVGQYRDRFAADDDERFYAIPRTAGETVTASVNSLVPPTGSYNAEYWYLKLTTAGGESCDAANTLSETQNTTLVVSGAVVSDTATAAPACATDPLVLSVKRRSTGNTRTAPAEIVVATEPPIVNLAALPDPIDRYADSGRAVGASEKRTPVVGGNSFTNAATLTPGTYTDAPAVGESVFYRVSLQPGQRLATTVKAPANPKAWELTNVQTVTVATVLYSPSRVPLTKQSVGLQGSNGGKVTAYSPQVRIRNREISHGTAVTTEGDLRQNASYASVAGDYFVSVQVRAGTPDVLGQVLPIRLSLRVDGTPLGLPEYGTSAASPTPTSSASPTPGSRRHLRPRSRALGRGPAGHPWRWPVRSARTWPALPRWSSPGSAGRGAGSVWHPAGVPGC